MTDSKSYLIHFEPPQEISNAILDLFNTVTNSFENKYNSIVDGVWKSHLMVYLSPMPISNEDKILEAVETSCKTLIPFEIELGKIVKGTGGYIFIEIDKKAQSQLKDIRNKLIKILQPLRDTSIKQKYLDRWEQFSEVEKERIKTTGLPYEYKSHFTVAQVPEGKEEEAISLVKNNSLTGKSFLANRLQVISYQNGMNTVIGKYPLENQ